MHITKCFLTLIFISVSFYLASQVVNEAGCVDSLTNEDLIRNNFYLENIVFKREKDKMEKPYEVVYFDSTNIYFKLYTGQVLTGTYYLYRSQIYYEFNSIEKGLFSVNCFNPTEMEMNVGVYYFDPKKKVMTSARRTFIFRVRNK